MINVLRPIDPRVGKKVGPHRSGNDVPDVPDARPQFDGLAGLATKKGRNFLVEITVNFPEDRLFSPVGQILLNLLLMFLERLFQMEPYLLIFIHALVMMDSMIRALCNTRVILLTPAVLS